MAGPYPPPPKKKGLNKLPVILGKTHFKKKISQYTYIYIYDRAQTRFFNFGKISNINIYIYKITADFLYGHERLSPRIAIYNFPFF